MDRAGTGVDTAGKGFVDCEACTDDSEGRCCSTWRHGPPEDGGDLSGVALAGEKPVDVAVRTGEGRLADMMLLGVEAVVGRAGDLDASVSAMMLLRSTLVIISHSSDEGSRSKNDSPPRLNCLGLPRHLPIF